MATQGIIASAANPTDPNALTNPVTAPATSTSPSAVMPDATAGTAYSPSAAGVNPTSDNTVGQTLAAPTAATVTGYGATSANFAPSDNVIGVMGGLMDPNSPLNQQAVTNAKQIAANSGMLNSSMASTGGTHAILKNALSIATPQAANTLNLGEFNANAQNQAGQFNANAANTASLQQNSLGYDAAKTNVNQANTQANMGLQNKFNTADMNQQAQIALNQLSAQQQNTVANLAIQQGYTLANMTAQQINTLAQQAQAQSAAVNLANLNNESQAAIQAAHDKNAATIQNSTGAQSLYNAYLNDVASINASTTMDAAAKTAALTNLGQTLQTGMDAYSKGQMPDVSSLLQQMNVTGSPNPNTNSGTGTQPMSGGPTDRSQISGGA